ncbi:MAG: GNAT family N-acetyltransferase [Sumerlaeia bacterium]
MNERVQEWDLSEGARAIAWDEALGAIPGGDNPFLQSAWLGGLRGCLGQELRAFALRGRDDEGIRAAIAGTRFGRWGIHGLRRPFATPLCCPVAASPEDRDRLFKALQEHYLFLEMAFPPGEAVPETWAADGARLGQKATHLLDLGNAEELWNGFKGELRTNIRKALKLGIMVEPDGEDWPGFFRLYRGLFEERLGARLPFGEQRFAELCRAVVAGGAGRLYEARDRQGRLHVSALILIEPRRGHAAYALSASDPELRKSGANSCLLWRVFQDCERPGAVFDFVGANLPNMARYKRNFRGREAMTYQLETARWPWAGKALRALRQVRAS